ncbi:MAG TPA: hypothetical protein VG106_07745 [Vicinamibacterales bacterium]|nr:hypothetical protein [Vicinamibacterales bacterium]
MTVIFQTEVELQCRFVLFGMAQLEQVRLEQADRLKRLDEIDAGAAIRDDPRQQGTTQ